MIKTINDRAYGLGRRKTAIARVWINKESPDKNVNGLQLESYFQTVAAQKSALSPLELTATADKYGFAAKVQGGGKVAQADALKLAIARALLTIDPAWHKQLKMGRMLTRDYRVKERKKPGLKRARRAPQFSKR